MTEVTSLFKKRILHLCKSEQWFKDDSNFHLLDDVESLPDILEIINLQVMRAIIGYYKYQLKSKHVFITKTL